MAPDGRSDRHDYAYQDPSTGTRIEPWANLADDYQAANLPVVRAAHQVGERLMWVLNEVF